MPKRILVIGHDAYRAGAQISLLHILRWLKGNYPADLTLLLRAGGALVDDYASLLPTRLCEPPPGAGSAQRREHVLRRLARAVIHPPAKLGRDLDLARMDLIYCNTVVSLDLLPELLSARHCPAICHVHELEMATRRFVSVERFRRAQPYADAYIAASRAVATNLVNNHGVSPARIHQIYEAIALPPLRATAGTGAVQDTLSLPPNAFVVGGCGTMDWRKSPELFLQVAHRLRRHTPGRPVHFVWVGGHASGSEFDRLTYDIEKMGLRGSVHLVGPQSEPMKYFSRFDVFLLTSREDPFPLVCLEAAALRVPTICFADAGGMPEFVQDDAGFVVPYLDIDRAAQCILSLVHSEALRSQLGRRAAEKAQDHDIELIGPQVAAVLDKYAR
ncbi:MAG: glycosyltransferase family 4 protein [Candidatus Rokuibacteriota bacterium]